MKEFFKSFQGQTLIVLCVAVIILAFIYFLKKDKNILSTKALTISAIFLALGIVTNQITVYSLPTGGSVTLFSMFFIAYIGYMFGLKIGVLSAVTYGLLNLLIKPSVYYPAQLVVDYILAFGSLGLSGLFYNKKNGLTLGYVVAILGRFIFSFLSGYIFFGQYAPEGWHPAMYSFVYNISYIGIEGIITIIVIVIPFVATTLEKIKQMNYKK